MQLHLDRGSNMYRVTAYGADYVAVNERMYTSSLIISPTTLITDWMPQTFGAIEARHLEPIMRLEPAVILLGTGARQGFLDASALADVMAQGIAVEMMSTAAACRTYNILAMEGRAVVAALLMTRG